MSEPTTVQHMYDNPDRGSFRKIPKGGKSTLEDIWGGGGRIASNIQF